jgi:quercetin dioxygenase-like cupin family protein
MINKFDNTKITFIKDCKKTTKPWGYEVLWAETKNYIAKMMYILPEKRMSLQYHKEKEETIYVMRGELIVWENENDDEYIKLNPGSIYHVKPTMVHRFGAKEQPVMLMEVSTNYLDDIVRIKDDFKRK